MEPGRKVLAAVMVAMGVLHFTHGPTFASIVPDYLPFPLLLTYVSGVFEIALGVLLLNESTRWLAAWGLIALFVAVFPANINMALHPNLEIAGIPGDFHIPPWALWARLPLQAALIYWASRYIRARRLSPAI